MNCLDKFLVENSIFRRHFGTARHDGVTLDPISLNICWHQTQLLPWVFCFMLTLHPFYTPNILDDISISVRKWKRFLFLMLMFMSRCKPGLNCFFLCKQRNKYSWGFMLRDKGDRQQRHPLLRVQSIMVPHILRAACFNGHDFEMFYKSYRHSLSPWLTPFSHYFPFSQFQLVERRCFYALECIMGNQGNSLKEKIHGCKIFSQLCIKETFLVINLRYV